jgi:hypothetical protein
MKQFLKYLPFLIIIFLSIPLILPYLHAGFFPTHDGEWAVVRLSDMFRSLRDHQFPVRYSGVLNFEYGYPLFNFAYPFPYYVGILFHFLHINFVDSIKILFALSVPLSLIFMYFASARIWQKRLAGYMSIILYAYLPYRFVDLYVRGSLGESFAFVLFPFILLTWTFIPKRPRLGVPGVSLGVAMLVMSHNIMTVLFMPILLTLMFASAWKERSLIWPYMYSLVIALLLSAFFWLPALAEKHLIALSITPIADRYLYFLKPQDLFVPKWGYGIPNAPDGFGYQLGLSHIGIFFLVIVTALLSLRKKAKKETLSRSVLPLGIVMVFAMIALLYSPTAFIWEHTSLLKEINYPWTLLLPLGFLVSLLGGYLTIQKDVWKWLGIIVSATAIIILPHAKPSTYANRGEGFYTTNEATTTSSSELMPLWVKHNPYQRPVEKMQVVKGSGTTIVSENKSNKLIASITMKTSGAVQINTIYYPGWKVLIDGISKQITYKNNAGVMDIQVPVGNHSLVASLGETTERKIADALSIIGIATLITYLIYPRRSIGS